MDDSVPLARSPIAVTPPEAVVAGWVVSARTSRAALTVTDCTPLAKVAVKASYEVFDVPFGRIGRQDWDGIEVLLIGSGPGEWLALGPAGEQRVLLDLLKGVGDRAGELVTVVDQTHGRALVRLTGAQAAELLAKECAIDLAARADGSALRTGVAGLATDVVRDDRAGVPSYLLHCERSSGAYLYDVLSDAGAEFGIEPDGFRGC